MHLLFIAPQPAPPGGGTQFNDGMMPALRALGHTVESAAPDAPVPPGAVPVIDGLALPAVAARIDALAAQGAVAIVHHASAAAGRDLAAREEVRALERAVLPRLRRVVSTSAAVAERLVQDYGVAAPVVLQPGMAELPRSTGSGGTSCRILSAGVLTPRKGHDRLMQALAPLLDLEWSLLIAGDAQRDPVHAAGLPALALSLRIAPRVELLADPDGAALAGAWAGADLFVTASSWEGYPAGVAEALRRGVPAVALAVGGVPALLPQSAGMVCAPDDPSTFSKCLRRAVHDRGLRAAMAAGAWAAGQRLPGWPQQARAFEALLDGAV